LCEPWGLVVLTDLNMLTKSLFGQLRDIVRRPAWVRKSCPTRRDRDDGSCWYLLVGLSLDEMLDHNVEAL
jgi:hypothetical protein